MRGLRQHLHKGGEAIGAGLHIPSAAVVEVLCWAGYDFIGIDLEHGGICLDHLENLVLAADRHDVATVVRVPFVGSPNIGWMLDLGVEGILFPRVRTRADVEVAIAACRFIGGNRGGCPIVRATGYGKTPWVDYETSSDRETLVVLLIEDTTSAARAEELISVAGVGAVMPGPFDMALSSQLGLEERTQEVTAAVDQIAAAAHHCNVPLMVSCGDGATALEWKDRGARLIVDSADTQILLRGSESFLTPLRR